MGGFLGDYTIVITRSFGTYDVVLNYARRINYEMLLMPMQEAFFGRVLLDRSKSDQLDELDIPLNDELLLGLGAGATTATTSGMSKRTTNRDPFEFCDSPSLNTGIVGVGGDYDPTRAATGGNSWPNNGRGDAFRAGSRDDGLPSTIGGSSGGGGAGGSARPLNDDDGSDKDHNILRGLCLFVYSI